MRLLFTAAGYVSFATLLTAALGLGYLWQTRRLDDEKAFQIVALLHDVDLDKVAEQDEPSDRQETPPEEMSPAQAQVAREVLLRDHEVKEESLKRSRQEFDFWYAEFKDMRDKADRVVTQVEQRLNQENDDVTRESVENVVRNLELIEAREAKDQIRRILKEDKGVESVIMLLDAMQDEKRKKILKTFNTEDERADLYDILRVMRRGGPEKAALDDYLDEISGLNSDE